MSLTSVVEWFRRVIDHAAARAFKEVGSNALMGLAPVWLGIITSLVVGKITLWSALTSNAAKGDLFLGATTIAAPVALYLTSRRRDIIKPFTVHFPGGTIYLLILFFLYATSIILFVIKRLVDLHLMSSPIDEEFFQGGSVVVFVASILLTFFVTATRFLIDESDAGVFRKGQAEFNMRWEHRER